MNFLKKAFLTLLIIFTSIHHNSSQATSEQPTKSDMKMLSMLADFKSGKIGLPELIKKFPKGMLTKKIKNTNLVFMILEKLPCADQRKCIEFNGRYPKLINKLLLVCINIVESILQKKAFDLEKYATMKKSVITELNKLGFGIPTQTQSTKYTVTHSKRKDIKAMLICIAQAFESVVTKNKKITSIIPDDMYDTLTDNLTFLRKIIIHDDVIEAVGEYLHHTEIIGLHKLVKNSTFTKILHCMCNLIPNKIFEAGKMLLFDDTKSLHLTTDDIDALIDIEDINLDDFDF